MFLKVEGKDYICNFYRSKLYDKNSLQYLITLDDGKFLFFNHEIFKEFKKGKIKHESTFSLAEEKGLIITPSNISKVISSIQKRYQFLENGTSLHIIVPTTRCTLSCPYCFANPQKISDDPKLYDMDKTTSLQTIEYIMKSPCPAATLEFTGGEATARFDLVKLMIEYALELNKIYKKDLRFSIVTNLSLMNEEMADYLIEKKVGICTSLDGPEIINDKNRFIEGANNKKIGTYQKVVYWIERINEKYREKKINEKVNALMTITRFSFKYYKEILDLYVELGIYNVDIRAMMYIGKAQVNPHDPNQYPYEEFTQFYKNCLNYIKELNEKGIPVEDRMTQLYKKKIYENEPTYHVDFESPWGAGTGSLTYAPNGDIYACHESVGKDEFLLGNITTHSWKKLFGTKAMSSTVLTSMLESNPICDACVYKPYCGTLPIENLYAQKKFNFYPSKTMKHHETIFHCENNFNKELKKITSNSKQHLIQVFDEIKLQKNQFLPKELPKEELKKIYTHLKNTEVTGKNKELFFAQVLKEKKINNNRITYHCFELQEFEKNEKEKEKNLLLEVTKNSIIKKIIEKTIDQDAITQFYISLSKTHKGNIRKTFHLEITPKSLEIFKKYFQIPQNTFQENRQYTLLGIDTIDEKISEFKIYQKVSKTSEKLKKHPYKILNFNIEQLFLTKRYDKNFKQKSYKFEIHEKKSTNKLYEKEFLPLLENKNTPIIAYTPEFNKKNKLLKSTLYYRVIF